MRRRINLITKNKQGIAEELVYFIGHYLRYILVITQIIVIFVFFYKLNIDQEIIDLEEAISQKKEIINVAQPMTDEYLLYSYKLTVIENYLDQQQKFKEQLNYFLSRFPQGVFLTKMDYTKEGLAIEGYSNDPALIRKFYYRLKEEKRFGEVSLEKIQKEENNFNFSMKLTKFK